MQGDEAGWLTFKQFWEDNKPTQNLILFLQFVIVILVLIFVFNFSYIKKEQYQKPQQNNESRYDQLIKEQESKGVVIDSNVINKTIDQIYDEQVKNNMEDIEKGDNIDDITIINTQTQ